jgi:hypothetical protein
LGTTPISSRVSTPAVCRSSTDGYFRGCASALALRVGAPPLRSILTRPGEGPVLEVSGQSYEDDTHIGAWYAAPGCNP